MARRPRTALGGMAYHVMNRVSGRQDLFEDAGDYEAFERVLGEAREREAMRVCAYALMPDHFHQTSGRPCWMMGRWIVREAGAEL